jgi:hypothetical protein
VGIWWPWSTKRHTHTSIYQLRSAHLTWRKKTTCHTHMNCLHHWHHLKPTRILSRQTKHHYKNCDKSIARNAANSKSLVRKDIGSCSPCPEVPAPVRIMKKVFWRVEKWERVLVLEKGNWRRKDGVTSNTRCWHRYKLENKRIVKKLSTHTTSANQWLTDGKC